MNKTTLIARVFSALLLLRLGEETMNKIVALNQEEKDPNICHSHDFCDSNVIFALAFSVCTTKYLDTQDEEQMRLKDGAWTAAREDGFYLHVLTYAL